MERKEVIWNLKCFDPWLSLSSLCYVEQSEARVKLHGAPGLAETMLMTQNRFKLYNSPTVKTLPWVQPELQPIYRIYFWKQQEWRLEDSDHISGWSHLILVCLFLKTGRSLLKVFPHRRKPTLKNILPIFQPNQNHLSKNKKFRPHILSNWPI